VGGRAGIGAEIRHTKTPMFLRMVLIMYKVDITGSNGKFRHVLAASQRSAKALIEGQFQTPREAERDGAGREPCLFAEMNKAINGWPVKTRLLLTDGYKPISQRLHEAHDRILICVRQAQSPNSARVHVVGRLRRRPARRTFSGIIRLASRQHIARIVEMHDRFQAREITIVPVRLHESGIRPLVNITQRRHLNSSLVVWRQLAPSLIHRGGVA